MTALKTIRAVFAVGLIAFIGKNCFTTDRHVDSLTRMFQKEARTFVVSSPLLIHGEKKTRIEQFDFKALPDSVLEGTALNARVSKYNQYGQDVILHYSDGAEPTKAVILLGADEAISAQLRSLGGAFTQPGAAIRLEGAFLELTKATWDV